MRIVLALVVLAILAVLVFVALEFDKVANVTTGEDATVGSTVEETATPSDQGTASEQSATTGDQGADETGAADEATDGATQTGNGAATGDDDAVEDSTATATGEPIAPKFDIVRVEKTGDAVMAGHAEPFAIVEIHDQNGLVASTQADEKGDWVIVLDEPLAPGSHELSLESKPELGAAGVPSEETVVMLIPEPEDQNASASVTVTTNTQQSGAQDEVGAASDEAIAVLVPKEDDGQVVILQEPNEGIGIAGGDGLSLDTLDYDASGDVTLSGRAEAGAEVRAYVDGELSGRAVADATGSWSMTLDQPVELGLHSLRVDQVNEEGQVLGRLETPFDRESLQFPESAEPLVIIQPGNNLWTIAHHTYGSGMHYTQIFQANQGQIGDPDLIYPGQIFVLPEIN